MCRSAASSRPAPERASAARRQTSTPSPTLAGSPCARTSHRTRSRSEHSVSVPDRTQVGFGGGAPAGLLLSHLLARAGVDSVVLESRDRAYVEARQRAGVIEAAT